MFGKHIFKEVTSKPGEAITSSPTEDVRKNVGAMLPSAFSRMDLITREEFGIQQQVLTKTRTKLAELEERLAKLESARISEETVPEAAEITRQTKPIEQGRLKGGDRNKTGC